MTDTEALGQPDWRRATKLRQVSTQLQAVLYFKWDRTLALVRFLEPMPRLMNDYLHYNCYEMTINE